MRSNKTNNTLKNFIKHESFGGILLFFCVAIAMIFANSSFGYLYIDTWNMYLDFKLGNFSIIHISLLHFINDVLMSFFFLMIGLEMKREVLYGELAGFKSVSFSAFGALGGLIVPSMIYLYFNYNTPSSNGFGVAMSTDTAFALGVILLLGSRIPSIIKIFLVTLAVADDLGTIIVMAVFYTENLNINFIYLACIFLLILIILNYLDVKYISMYFLFGTLLWFCVFFSGVHPTVAAVILAFTIPGKSQISRHSFLGLKEAYNKIYFDIRPEYTIFEPAKLIEDSKIKKIFYSFADFFIGSYNNIKKFITSKSDIERQIDMQKEHKRVEILDTVSRYSRYAQNPLVRIEFILQPLNAYLIVPLFAFANAGINITNSSIDFGIDGIMLGIMLGLILGKPIGIFTFTIISEKIGLAKRPKGLKNTQIISVGLLAGIGFTMSMFVANLAYSSNKLIDLAKISVLLASLISAIIGTLGLFFSTEKNNDEEIEDEE